MISDYASDVAVHDNSVASSAVKTAHRNVLCSSAGLVPTWRQLWGGKMGVAHNCRTSGEHITTTSFEPSAPLREVIRQQKARNQEE